MMPLFERIAAFWETSLSMTKPQTADDFAALARSLRETDLPQAQAALDEIEAAFDQEYFELASNDIALKRAEKKRDEARANLARIQDAMRRAEKHAERLATEAFRAAQVERARETDVLLAQRTGAAGKLDEHIAGLAAAYLDLLRLNAAVFERAPTRMRHWPGMFAGSTLQPIIEQRLFGLTDGKWAGVVGLETPFTAKQLRTLKTRAAEERAHVMSQQPQPDNTPPAAA